MAKPDRSFIAGTMATPAGEVPVARAAWRASDWLGAAAVRLGIRRGAYRVEPGLYAVGSPTAASPAPSTTTGMPSPPRP